VYYRSTLLIAASLSVALAGCSTSAPAGDAPAVAAANSPSGNAPPSATQQASSGPPGEMDTEATLWTVLGLAKKESERDPGPQTGNTVSPTLWQSAHDTLNFVTIASDDPITGALVTDWYSPRGKPNERYRIHVFILARQLRSDSLAVTAERQERQPGGQWKSTPVARELATDLETAILQRAGEIRRARAANS